MAKHKLFEAVEEGDVESLRNLLKNSKGTEDYGALLLLALDRNFPETAILLLENKADPNVRDDGGNTPLFYAVAYHNIQSITSLLGHKANPNIQNHVGKTALHSSAKLEGKKSVKLLLENKADPNIPDDYGETPIFYARNPKIFTLFLEHNADIDFKNKEEHSIRYLLEEPSLFEYNSHLRDALNDYSTKQLQNIKVADEGVAVTEPDNQVNLLAEENASNNAQDIS